MKTRFILAVALILVGVTLGRAQTPVQLIDGSQHPEQIPDIVCFRYWLEAHTQNNALTGVDRVGLLSIDIPALTSTMSNYQVAFKKLSAASVHDWPATYTLVNSLYAALEAKLSANGLTQLHNFLQVYKVGLQVSPYDYGLFATTTAWQQAIKEANMNASMSRPTMMQGGMTPNYGMAWDSWIQFPNITHTDTFHRANGAPGSPWVMNGSGFSISNNQLALGVGQLVYNSPTDNAQSATAIVGGLPGYSNGVGQSQGVCVRMSTTSHTSYCIYYGNYGNGISLLWGAKWKNGVMGGFSSGSSSYQGRLATGDSITLRISGSDLEVSYNNRSVLSFTDSDITSGYTGIDTTWGTSGTFTNFVAGSGYQFNIQGTLTGNTICGGGSCPNGATHTGSVTLGYGSTQSTDYGNSIPPQSYMNVQYGQAFDIGDLPGDSNTLVPIWGGQVQCSFVGILFSSSGPGSGGGMIENKMITYTQNTGQTIGNPAFGYVIAPICTPSSTPPDWAPDVLQSLDGNPPPPPNFNYYKLRTICWRPANSPSGTRWSCAPAVRVGVETFEIQYKTQDNATEDFIDYGNGSAWPCSLWDKGISGRPW